MSYCGTPCTHRVTVRDMQRCFLVLKIKKKSTNVSGTVSIMSPRALSLSLSEKPRRASKAFISEVTLKTEFVQLKDR